MDIKSWFKDSHHWQHLVGGILIGVLSLGCWYAAMLAGVGISSALEFKDKLWGGKWDWIDWIITVFGCCLGYSLSLIIKVFLV